MAYDEFRVASEYDGREFHTSDSDRASDDARRLDLERRLGWRFNIGTYERLFGTSPEFEIELGALLGLTPKPRTWH